MTLTIPNNIPNIVNTDIIEEISVQAFISDNNVATLPLVNTDHTPSKSCKVKETIGVKTIMSVMINLI